MGHINNDLFELVKTEKLSNQTKFWGKYEFLNNIPEANMDEEALFRYQISRIKILETQNPGLKKANEILNQMNQVQPMVIQNEIVELSMNKIYIRILELLNSPFISSPSSIKGAHLEKKEGNTKYTYKEGSSKETIKRDQDSAIAELDALLEIIKYPDRVNLVSNLQRGLEGKGLKRATGFSTYKEYKSNEAEKLMIYALSQSSPGWRAIVSGSFFNKGQQLIEDGFVFNSMDMDIKFDQNFKATIYKKNSGKGKEKLISSLKDFFELANSLNRNESISLSDELYAKLQQLSLLKAQAKSGFSVQELINKTTQRGAISLEATGASASIYGLWILYVLGWINSEKTSKSLPHIANYCLSKSIALTSLMDNDIYFTRDGFITASQWMQTYKYMLKFNPSILKISNGFLSNENPYRLMPVN